MVGELAEIDYHSLRQQHESDQSSLDDWTEFDETFVAVVSKPRDTGIDEICDEHWPELGMPEWALTRFWQTRAGYRTNSAVDNPHNKAYNDCDLDGIYYNYLHESREAQKRVSETVERLESGENITLVCFEGDGEHCHRHLLIDVVERRQSCEFTLTV